MSNTTSVHERRAVGALYRYLTEVCKISGTIFSGAQRRAENMYLHMEEFTRRALCLHPQSSPPDQPTLFALLNDTHTAAGKRLLWWRVLNPLAHETAIGHRLDSVQAFYDRRHTLSAVRTVLERLPDGEIALGRLLRSEEKEGDWGHLLATLEAMDAVCQHVREADVAQAE